MFLRLIKVWKSWEKIPSWFRRPWSMCHLPAHPTQCAPLGAHCPHWGLSDPPAVLGRGLLWPLSNYSKTRKKGRLAVPGTWGFRATADEIAFLLGCRKWRRFIKVGNSWCCQTGFSLLGPDWAKCWVRAAAGALLAGMLHAFKLYSALTLSLLVYIYPAFILILFNTIYWGWC